MFYIERNVCMGRGVVCTCTCIVGCPKMKYKTPLLGELPKCSEVWHLQRVTCGMMERLHSEPRAGRQSGSYVTLDKSFSFHFLTFGTRTLMPTSQGCVNQMKLSLGKPFVKP